MKKIFVALFVGTILLAFGSGGVHAQEWSWENPIPIALPKLVEITADSTTGAVFGVDDTGAIRPIDVTSTAPTVLSSLSTLSGERPRTSLLTQMARSTCARRER